MPTKLTDAIIKGLAHKPAPYFVWDSQAKGLSVKVTPAKRKLLVCQLKFPGHSVQSKRTVGQWPGLTLDDARATAQRWRDQVKVGIDPHEVEAAQRRRAERERANTFSAVVAQYLEGRTAYRRHEQTKAEIYRKLIPEFGDRPIATITPRDVREFISAEAKRAPYSASNTWRNLVSIFKFAVHNDLVGSSPCASLTKRLLLNGHTLPPRERVLSDTELAALWRATDQLGYPHGHFYKWLLMTGCRLGEAQGARWCEIAGDVWVVPPERFKSNTEHHVPLTDTMIALLETIPRQGEYLFSSDGVNPINGMSKLKHKVDALMHELLREVKPLGNSGPGCKPWGDVPNWCNHDLRRTVRSNLSALGVADQVAELVIGHGRRGIARVYDRHKYLNEVRAALTLWQGRFACHHGILYTERSRK